MLISLKSMLGYRLQAYDGIIGKVSDFYFDDHSWRLRYGIINVGTFFSPYEVLIDASVLGQPDTAKRLWPVRLTQDQIGGSPSIRTAKPVCRQEEERRRCFYSWPLYWEPSIAFPTGSVILSEPDTEVTEETPTPEKCDPHLRSFLEIVGYQVKALDGYVGVVEDFILDDVDLRLTRLVVHTSNRFLGRRLVLGVECVDRLTWAQQCVDLRLTRSVSGLPQFVPQNARRVIETVSLPAHWPSSS